MRNIILAAAIALSGTLSLGAVQAEAATTKIIIKDNNRGHHRDYRHGRTTRVIERRGPNCFSRKVVTRVRGERIVKTTRVCR